MRAFNTRFKKIEGAVRERYARRIEEMENQKFLETLRNSPAWLPEVYAFYFRMIEQANRCLKEMRPNVSGQRIGRPMDPKAYAFILERVGELLRENLGQRVGREEVKGLSLSVIESSPYLRGERREVLLNAASTTLIQDEDIGRIHGE